MGRSVRHTTAFCSTARSSSCAMVADMLQVPQNIKLAPNEQFFPAFHFMNDYVIDVDMAYEAAEITDFRILFASCSSYLI
jgi:hypothetical protein